eukprot:SAG11_NODE_1421_length_4953_cov_8.908735_2_plen_70_part_00
MDPVLKAPGGTTTRDPDRGGTRLVAGIDCGLDCRRVHSLVIMDGTMVGDDAFVIRVVVKLNSCTLSGMR